MNVLKAITNNAWDSLSHSFNLLWSTISPILLPLVYIIAFLAIGLWAAEFLSEKLGTIVKKSKIDFILDGLLAPVLKITGTKIHSSNIMLGAIKWFLIAMVLIAALDLADLTRVIGFLSQVLAYLPNVFVAALIIIAGSLLGNLAATVVGMVSKNGFPATARVAVNVLAFIAALGQLVTPIVGSLSQFIGQLSLSKLQADVLFIGIILLVVLASKNVVTKTVENLYKM